MEEAISSPINPTKPLRGLFLFPSTPKIDPCIVLDLWYNSYTVKENEMYTIEPTKNIFAGTRRLELAKQIVRTAIFSKELDSALQEVGTVTRNELVHLLTIIADETAPNKSEVK